MLANNLRKLSKFFPFICFLSTAIILGFFIAKLNLIADDNVHIFPAILGDFHSHFVKYTKDYGLFRPIALPYFYLIYTIYLYNSSLAHIIVWLIHLLGGYFYFKIFSKYRSIKFGTIVGLIYVAFPFFTEQYGWLAAGNATIASTILALQIYIICFSNFRKRTLIAVSFLLQIIGVLSYESLFFTGFSLAFFLLKKYKKTIRSSFFIFTSIIMLLPSLVYFLLRKTAFQPQQTDFAREVDINTLLTERVFYFLFLNLKSLFDNIFIIFSKDDYVNELWISNINTGIKTINNNPILWIFIILLLFCSSYLVFSKVKKNTNQDTLIDSKLILMLAITSIIPTLLLSEVLISMRVLALPLFFLITTFLLLIKNKHIYFVEVLGCAVFFASLFISIGIINNMEFQGRDDETSFIKIVEAVDAKIEKGEKTSIIILGQPQSSRTGILFGQYLNSCVSVDWCLEAALNRRTDKIEHIYINNEPIKTMGKNYIYFGYSPIDQSINYVQK